MKRKTIPLFECFPALAKELLHVELGDFPTPLVKLETLGPRIGVKQLYMKQDGLSGTPFGGNKVRKLEFILAEALTHRAKEVLTFGFAGSNHALATAVYAKKLGLRSISMLMPQANARYVRRNLLFGYRVGAEFHHCPNRAMLGLDTRFQLWVHRLKTGTSPFVIPPGGSSPMGTLGFVNAAFELKEQIDRGLMPGPDVIYLPMGTSGTLVGLLIGLKAANLVTRVVPVRVVDRSFMQEKDVLDLYKSTLELLCSLEPAFACTPPVPGRLGIVDDYLGAGYARFTTWGKEALELARESEGFLLDGTYTGKAFAALLADARKGELKDRVVLFWNTLNAHDLQPSIKGIDYRRLPRSLRRYFEKDVQPLDAP